MILSKEGTDDINERIGDAFEQTLLSSLSEQSDIAFESKLSFLRAKAISLEFRSIKFSNLLIPKEDISTLQKIQLLALESKLAELIYGFQSVHAAAEATGGGSAPTRFYLNSIYIYIFSLFLVDRWKKSHEGLDCGGIAILILHPLGLSELLTIINSFLETKYAGDTSLSDVICKVRNKFLVHGNLSPEVLEGMVHSTNMRDPENQAKFTYLLWKMYHLVLLLDFRIQATIEKLKIDPVSIVKEYMESIKKMR